MSLSAADRRRFEWAIHVNIEADYAADTSELSYFNWDDQDGFDGGDALLPGGYESIVLGLARGLDVRLGQTVRRVEHDESRVKVTTDRGQYSADHAIVTVPLGVLKRGSIEFVPALPQSKRQAIGALGMGLVNKVAVRFPTVFWDTDRHILGRIAEERGAWTCFLNLALYTGKPILVAFTAGGFARRLEKLTDEQTVVELMKALRSMFGSSIPEPEAAKLTRWASDPFAGGSYSFTPPGASGKDYAVLGEPVGKRLYFAGEATNRDYPATVHGAFLSGERAARTLIELG
jgi:monoamine oxidase